MKKLRLLLFEECNRNCPGCCNNDWGLQNLPIVMSYADYDQILLTGGEPLLHPETVKFVVKDIKKENSCPIYLYTAKTNNIPDFIDVLNYVDGICITLHTQADVKPFKVLNAYLLHKYRYAKSLQLNVFRDIKLENFDPPRWKVKKDMVWIKNCPLPENEVFMRL